MYNKAMSKKEIITGHTNREKYHIGDTFVLHMNKNGFNHYIDYSLLKEFDFVPKLLSNKDGILTWEWIDGEHLKNPTNEDIVQLATILRKLHKSEVRFPKNNMRKRVMSYLKTIHEKGLHISEIEDNYREMSKLLSRMGRLNPVHNDIWPENVLKDKNGKLWIVDWEYATMGDKHFDISYITRSFYFNIEQEKLFLDTYNSFDDYNAYITEWVPKYDRLVIWITLCWAYAQEKIPFPLEKLLEKLR